MAGSSWKAFAKTVLIPMLIALSLYIVLFLVLLPLYRRHRSQLARYANYAPLSTNLAQHTTSIFEPYLIEPSKSIIQTAKEAFVGVVRWLALPSSWSQNRDNTRGLGSSYSSGAGLGEDDEEEDEHHGGLFDAESGEAMVGFHTLQEERGRMRDRGTNGTEDDSNRRLSRELEEGFRDDSESEASDEEVTAGRRTLSRRASEVRRF